MRMVVGKFRAQDDIDVGGHHLRDWRHLSDIPSGGASAGQALVWGGTSWQPGTVAASGAGGASTWDEVQDKPTVFPPTAHTHLLTQITDYVAYTAGSNITITTNLTISATGVMTGLTAGTNVSTNGSTVAVVDAPTFAGTVSTNNITATSGTTVAFGDNVTIPGQATVGTTMLAEYVRQNLDSPGSVTKNQIVISATGASPVDVNTYKAFDVDMDFDIDTGAFFLGTVRAFNVDAGILGTGTGGASVQMFRGVLDSNKHTVASGAGTMPVYFANVDPISTQSWAQGFMRVDAIGGASAASEIIALYSTATLRGSGTGIGYRGFAGAAPGLTTATGGLIGVQGYVNINSATPAFAVGLDGSPVGTSLAANVIMGLRAQKHMLLRQGSVFVTTNVVNTPASLSPDHVQANTNFGEMYVQGIAEFDDEVFHDGNVAYSITTITADYTAAGITTILADANSTTITVSLPAAAGVAMREYRVKKIDTSANDVIIDPDSAEQIEGATTYTLATSHEGAIIQTDGTAWYVLASI